VAISSILLTLAVCTAEDCLFVFINSAIAVLNIRIAVSLEFAGRLLLKTAMAELIKTKRQSSAVQTARVSRILEIATDDEMKKVEKNFTFLATIGSTAPFIGLFGTVWGIMNSFQSIAISRNTSLAIVAPGIAEALFATALGLLAAIPAVVAYNKFNSDSQRYFSKIENFSKRFLSII
jgi:biopolymer transport protein TolQ